MQSNAKRCQAKTTNMGRRRGERERGGKNTTICSALTNRIDMISFGSTNEEHRPGSKEAHFHLYQKSYSSLKKSSFSSPPSSWLCPSIVRRGTFCGMPSASLSLNLRGSRASPRRLSDPVSVGVFSCMYCSGCQPPKLQSIKAPRSQRL